ncbi:arginine--tRNA ligase [Spirochaeta lutea]|uniref:Arginine--tRNA ligase n=1 Tax=Spirochaeta lutea TaxID=1480694 RepID=A0A098R2I7_9SPIO|nr:arginine--tRNA ligase [Spirochaeta lutea]KGE73863.1 arginyl-tRNA synthetase [Spirochaeta lutea]
MEQMKERWRRLLFAVLAEIARERDIEFTSSLADFQVETPPKAELGDVAFPMFAFAKVLRVGPPQISASVVGVLEALIAGEKTLTSPGGEQVTGDGLTEEFRRGNLGTAEAMGPYVNVRLPRRRITLDLLKTVHTQQDRFGITDSLAGQKIMVEFSCPNTNKPLHLGHLRNDALGESIARILKANGAQVRKVNLINNRGVHICKSMLAYQRFGEGETPESTGIKPDHFVGKYYVAYANWVKEYPQAEAMAQEMLHQWEQGEAETMKLWKQMNEWAVEGIEETYQRTGISFDQVYYESETYLLGRSEILQGLEDDIFYKDEEGTVWIDLEPIGLDKKVLLRKDGTSLYITQDIGTAINRHKDWPFDRLIYVVASEQQYHFRVLFHVLSQLGYPWASNLYHLSYGMVNLPEGKMKSREGTVVDADDLLDQLTAMAKEEIVSKERQDQVEDLNATSHQIALGALHYYLLQTTPTKDMIFNSKDSLAFNGNTGPYLQYTGARISSMLRKWGKDLPPMTEDLAAVLTEEVEWELVKLIGSFPGIVSQAGMEYNPASMTGYLYELAKTFSRFYHDHPMLNAPVPELVQARVALAGAVLQVLKSGMNLINVPFLSSM